MKSFYDWRKTNANAIRRTYEVAACDERETNIPVSECTAEGGPAKCKWHGKILRNLGLQDYEPNDIRSDVRKIADEIERTGEVTDDDMEMLGLVDDYIQRGRIPSFRIPADLLRTDKVDGFPKWVRCMYYAIAASTDADPGADAANRKEIIREINMIKAFAEKNGSWSDSLREDARNRHGEMFAEGAESECYDAVDSVVKVNDALYQCNLPIVALERYMMHNYYFPSASVKMLGFGEIDEEGRLGFVLEQEKFDFAPEKVSPLAKDDYMASRGFVDAGFGDGTSYLSDEPAHLIYLGDMHYENIRRLKNGMVVVPDSLFILNFPSYGNEGDYDADFPPENMP